MRSRDVCGANADLDAIHQRWSSLRVKLSRRRDAAATSSSVRCKRLLLASHAEPRCLAAAALPAPPAQPAPPSAAIPSATTLYCQFIYHLIFVRNLALGIGIQNFPEGLAVSLPLQAAGFSVWRAFWYGQLSGMVEPVFGVLGAVAVAAAQPALPYALAFAAGAMIYVVADDIIPEANASGNGKLATWGCIIGFVVMMCLDVGLG